jgi:hypothetical protein
VSSAPTISQALRRLVRERAALRCEYCLLSEEDAFFTFEPDHIIAVKHGGATDASNLALACFDCNRFKGSDIASLDPETGILTPLFNPRSDPWTAHFQIHDGMIAPVTPIGRVTVAILRINLPERVEVRRELALRKRWPPPAGG